MPIANLFAWPLAYNDPRNWLDGYAYRIGLRPIYFLVAGAAALVIAWIRLRPCARANPIHALRYE